eukprot:scaffold191331_cov30-Tisochrysis_lutea.AAC.2
MRCVEGGEPACSRLFLADSLLQIPRPGLVQLANDREGGQGSWVGGCTINQDRLVGDDRCQGDLGDVLRRQDGLRGARVWA